MTHFDFYEVIKISRNINEIVVRAGLQFAKSVRSPSLVFHEIENSLCSDTRFLRKTMRRLTSDFTQIGLNALKLSIYITAHLDNLI